MAEVCVVLVVREGTESAGDVFLGLLGGGEFGGERGEWLTEAEDDVDEVLGAGCYRCVPLRRR